MIAGVSTEGIGEEDGEEPIVMKEEDLVMANRLDLLNLKTTTVLVIIGLLLFGYDYLRRANLYGKSSYPLPLPSRWLNAIQPISTLVVSTKRSKRSARGELGTARGGEFNGVQGW